MMAEYIEREAALNVCEMHYQHCLEVHDWCGDATANNIQEDIKTIPAADVVEVRHGKWYNGDMPTYGGYKCSVRELNTVEYNKPYCPNCGADMRGDG